jgi:DNA-directed RNA polymerase sigma subunit (sigma70/sigma32)
MKFSPNPTGGWTEEKLEAFHMRNWSIWSDYKSSRMTLRAVGDKYGLSRFRISQIVRKCDRMMRNPHRKAEYYWGA